jgi:hypothetical protein
MMNAGFGQPRRALRSEHNRKLCSVTSFPVRAALYQKATGKQFC